MIKIRITLLFVFCSIFCFSQNIKIHGVIKDENKLPIAYANVVLLDTENKKPVKGTISNENGEFFVEKIDKDKYILKITYLGFEEYSNELEITKNINLKTITLKENIEKLDGVTVVSKRPTVTRKVDRLVFNVENSTLSNNNVFDVLKQTPGVWVSDNKITIKNNTPIVYINDRRVYLSDNEIVQLLEGTSATVVKSIEVITNPPAKYDAEGSSVLNIVTSKNLITGYHGSVFGNYKQGFKYPKFSYGTSHFFKTKKLNTYLNFSDSPRKDFRNQYENVNFLDNNEIETSWTTDYNRVRESALKTINSNIDYDLNEKSNIGLTTNILYQPRRTGQLDINSSTEVFNNSMELDSIFNTFNNSVNEKTNLGFTLNYSRKLKKEGEKLTANAHYTYYDYADFQDVTTGYFFPDETVSFRNNQFQTYSDQNTQIFTGQFDYELPLEHGNFESGAKVSYINSESVLNQYFFENDEAQIDTNNSDVFLYDEINYAGYFSWSRDWTNWNLKLGLRAEYTDLTGESVVSDEINNNDYLRLFPSFYLLHSLNDNNQLYFSYNRRIYRPNYNQLNPFRLYLTDNSYSVGNPDLSIEIDDSFVFGYTLKNTYTFEVYYRYENNPVYQLTLQDSENNQIQNIYTNIDNGVSYGLDFTTYTSITNGWDLYWLSSLFNYKTTYNYISNENLVETDNWGLYLVVANYFSFLKDKSLTLDVVYSYIPRIVDGVSIISDRAGLDISLRKTFFDDKASLSIGVTDVFNTQNFTQTTKFIDQDYYLDSTMENRMFVFGFNYKFGNYKLKTNKKDIEVDERDRLGFNQK
ncbi:TonB-dependent receptor domain-containing protein [Neotamlana laminarinivorans]|uniref:TonB-dependent receptor n=1 Tax=Neotamlana laminarinivorans TaxID=2883124 RepID=A0A9X1L2W9_9FLAO|nr:outer membrane beta-barrel family protein [Tamlana laminarinivorans]MCB4797652.1 TonB-dependent receptor [Tamlana laminarinivorans]